MSRRRYPRRSRTSRATTNNSNITNADAIPYPTDFYSKFRYIMSIYLDNDFSEIITKKEPVSWQHNFIQLLLI